MRGWIDATETGDRAELEIEPSPSLWTELAVGSDRCLGRTCAHVGTCFSEAARERASHADLVIANHALYFADLGLRERRDGAGVLPEHDAVVFDEAHRLEETAATWLGGRVSGAGLHRLARDVDRACREANVPAPARALDRVERAAGELFDEVCPGTGRARLRRPPVLVFRALAERLVRARRGALRRERRAGRARGAGARRGRSTSRPASTPASSSGSSGPSLMRSPGRRSTCLGRYASGSGTTGRPRSSSRRRSAPATTSASSATGSGCAAPPSFASARRSVSTNRRCSTCPTGCRIRAPTVRSSSSPRRSPRCARSRRGRALVLTSSYRALDAIAGRLRGRLPYDVLVQGDAPRERLLERFGARGRLGARRDGDVLAGRRRPGRGAEPARDRQAAVPGPRRSARRGPLRADLGRGRRLVLRLLAAGGRAPAPSGLRPADPHALATAAWSRSSIRACGRDRTGGRSSRRCRRAGSCSERERSRFPLRRGDCGSLVTWRAVAKKARTPKPPRASGAGARQVQAPQKRSGPAKKPPGSSGSATGWAYEVLLADRRRRRRCSRSSASRSASASRAARRS